MNAVIIDDELKSHNVLKNLLSEYHPEVEVKGSGFSLEDGLELIYRESPELVFLDVEMPGGDGFELLKRISQPSFQVIFITAHNKYAISALRSGAVDFLLKPILIKELAGSINRAKERKEEKLAAEQLAILQEVHHNLIKMNSNILPSRIAIYNLGEIHYLDVKGIVNLRADKGCTEFYLNSSPHKVVSSLNIGEYVELFEPFDEFFQVHRSHIINLLCVKKVKRQDREIILNNKHQIPVSRNFYDPFMAKMKSLSNKF